MTTLVRTITAASQIRGIGVGVQSSGGNVAIRQNLVKTVGLVGAFGWQAAGFVDGSNGPMFSNGADFLNKFYPTGRIDAIFGEIGALDWGNLRVYNVRGTSPTAGAVTLVDSVSASSLVATARFTGPVSADFKVTVTANATTPTSRDVTVKKYAPDGTLLRSTSYLAVQVANGTVTDPGDPDIVFSKYAGATTQAAAIADQALSAGSLGTLSAASYGTGITAMGGTGGPDIILCVGVSAALADGVNALGYAAAITAAYDGKLYVACTESELTKAEAITAAEAIPAFNVRYGWPCVTRYGALTVGGYTGAGTLTGVSPGGLIAHGLQRVEPWTPLMMEAAVPSFAAVTAVEANGSVLSWSDIADLMDAGVCPIAATSTYGIVPHIEVTTKVDTATSLPMRGKVQRYAAQVAKDLSAALEPFLGKPLDIDLSEGSLGPETRRQIDAITAYMERERNAGRIVAGKNANGTPSPAYEVNGLSDVTPQDLAAGLWVIVVAYRQTPNAEFILLRVRQGTYIDIA